jgi:hypothetical protein
MARDSDNPGLSAAVSGLDRISPGSRDVPFLEMSDAGGVLLNAGATVLLPKPDGSWTLDSWEVMSTEAAKAGTYAGPADAK